MSSRALRAVARLAPVVLLAGLGAGRASAQLAAVNPFSFGVSGGALVPVGDFADAFETGYAVNGVIGLRAPTLPVSFRGEVGYSRNSLKDFDGNLRIISGVANVVFPFTAAPTAVVRPYLIGGVGVYNYRGSVTIDDDFDFSDSRAPRGGALATRTPVGGPVTQVSGRSVTVSDESRTRFGLNGGAGIELPLSGISAYAEARFQTIFAEGGRINAVPILVGIRF